MLELTKSNEDYLEAIGLLSEKNGTAQVRDIAEMLKVKMPSVT
ncbi:metal-dependent transcriptional regulator, partial [[Eubacterium] rectale]|nr:metal-dependent transcriptional regulator [Agathobacter rectalis]